MSDKLTPEQDCKECRLVNNYMKGYVGVYLCPNCTEVLIRRLAAENAKLVEALEFYADEDTWKGVGMGISKAEAYDKGYIARSALEKR